MPRPTRLPALARRNCKQLIKRLRSPLFLSHRNLSRAFRDLCQFALYLFNRAAGDRKHKPA